MLWPYLAYPLDSQINEESDVDELTSELRYLSDDEYIDTSDDPNLAASLRNGVLPQELQVLYALSLIGQGGRRFMASKCIQAIAQLEQEGHTDEQLKTVDTEATKNLSWQVYHRAMTEPLKKNSAFAFVSDLLKKVDKEREWAESLGPLFHIHLQHIKRTGDFDKILSDSLPLTPEDTLRRHQLQKIATAGCRMRLLNCEGLLSRNLTNQVIDEATSLIEFIVEILPRLWRVESNGSVLGSGTEVSGYLLSSVRWYGP